MRRLLLEGSRRVVALAARFVPRNERDRFQKEWEAEIAYGARGADIATARSIFARSLGALPHGLSVLKQEWRWDMLSQDLRYAFRTLGMRPWFVVAAGATLAIGIGANAALFSVIDAVLLRPLPYTEPDRLVAVYESQEDRGGSRDGPSPANVLDWRRESSSLDGIAAWWIHSETLLGDDYGSTAEVPTARVSADFFHVFAVEPLLGRTFTDAEVADGSRVIVLSHELWRRRYGGDDSVVDRDIRFKNASWRVIGVMPSGFRPPGTLRGEVQIFKPMDFARDYAHLPAIPRDFRFLRAAARIRSNVSLESARAELDGIAAGIAEAFPKTNAGWGVLLVPLRNAIVGDTRVALWILLGAVGLVLLLAAANVTSLLLVRASGRSREMAVRTALGASRLRLVRQLFLESFLLAGLGLVLGVALAYLIVPVLQRFEPGGIPRIDEAAVDTRVLVFACIVSLIAGLAAGLAPAFQGSSTRVSEALKSSGAGASADGSRQRLRSLIVVGEIAIAVLLLAVSVLFLKSLSHVLAVDPGFDAKNLIVVRMRLDGETYGRGGADAYYTELLERIRALPGVVNAGGTTGLPMDELDTDFDRPFWLDGEPRPVGGGPGAQIRMATVGYFTTMHIPLLDGRDVDTRDDRTKPRVALVNETMADRAWPGERAVGRRVFVDYQGYEAPYEVVGVVGDTRFYGHKATPKPAIYIPHRQNPYLPLNLVVRATGDPEALAPLVRATALEIDPAQPVHSIRVMDELMGGYLTRDRFAALLMTSFAAIALLLSTIGIYGVVAFAVSARQRELGLRLALGAKGTDIVRLVLGSGLSLAAMGAVAGVTLALLASRTLGSVLYEVSATDPGALLAAALLLMGTVLVACYVPARRAAGVDPTRTLRYE